MTGRGGTSRNMTPSTERWLNEKLSDSGLGPIARDEEFWGQMWGHALAGAEMDLETSEARPIGVVHREARLNMLHAIETLYYGVYVTKL